MMMKKPCRPILVAALAGAVIVSALPAPATAQLAVTDAGNYAQNVLQAARALQQINQQVQMLQNQAQHLKKLDSSSLGQMTQSLRKIDQLIGKAEGMADDVAAVDRRFAALFPAPQAGATPAERVVHQAKARWESAMSAFRQTMGVQAQVVENVRADGAVLAELVEQSQGAVGGLQAAQATNQLLALAAKQQFQIQTLMAAQYRAEAMEQARRAQAEVEARAATKRFLGRGSAYAPH